MSATMRVFEKSATVLAFIQKIMSISTEKEGKGKELLGGRGKKWKGKKMNPKCNLLTSEETPGTLYASVIQFHTNSSRMTAC